MPHNKGEVIMCFEDLTNKLVDQFAFIWNGLSQANKVAWKSTFDDFIQTVDAIKTEARKSSGGRNPNMMYFEGLSWAKKDISERPKRITISISRGETPIISFDVDRSMNWVLYNGMMVYRIAKQGSRKEDPIHFCDHLRQCLKKLAEKEEQNPGWFAANVYPVAYDEDAVGVDVETETQTETETTHVYTDTPIPPKTASKQKKEKAAKPSAPASATMTAEPSGKGRRMVFVEE
jgi:hypothetical protein